MHEKENKISPTENQKTRTALNTLGTAPEDFFDTILPLHIARNREEQPVLLTEFLKILAENGSFPKAAAALNMPESTVRQMGKGWLNFLKDKGMLAIPKLSLGQRWRTKIENLKAEYENYQKIVEFVGTDSYQENAKLLDGLRVTREQSSKERESWTILDLLFYASGWGVDKIEPSDLAERMGRVYKLIPATIDGAKAFLNNTFGLTLSFEPSENALRISESLSVQFDRLVMAQDYLENHAGELLAVEKRVLNRYLLGWTEAEIEADVKTMQSAEERDMLVATAGSVRHFLEQVFEMRLGTHPFARVRMAKQAHDVLAQNPTLKSDEHLVLEAIQRGQPFTEISEQIGLPLNTVKNIAYEYGIKMYEREADRRVVLKRRMELLAKIEAVSSDADWPGKETDLEILRSLTQPSDKDYQPLDPRTVLESNAPLILPTHEDVEEQMAVGKGRASIAMARIRAMVRQEGEYPERYRHLG